MRGRENVCRFFCRLNLTLSFRATGDFECTALIKEINKRTTVRVARKACAAGYHLPRHTSSIGARLAERSRRLKTNAGC